MTRARMCVYTVRSQLFKTFQTLELHGTVLEYWTLHPKAVEQSMYAHTHPDIIMYELNLAHNVVKNVLVRILSSRKASTVVFE